MTKKCFAVGILSSILLAIMLASSCFADGWAGEQSYGSAVDSGGGIGSGNYDKMLSWVHFTYAGNKDGQRTWIVPQYVVDDNYSYKIPVVSGMCARKDAGFWTYGRITKHIDGTFPEVDNWWEKGVDENLEDLGGGRYSAHGVYYAGIQASYLRRWADGYTNNTYINADGEYMIYRNKQRYGWAIYDTLSYSSDSSYPATPGGATSEQTLYYATNGNQGNMYTDNSANTHKMYVLDKVASSMSQVYDSYRAYMKYTDQNPSGMTDDQIDALMRSRNTYAFCSFENIVRKETTLDTKSKIELDGTGTKNESGWDTKTTNSSVYTFKSKKPFKLKFSFDYQRNSPVDFATQAISNGSSISVYRINPDGSRSVLSSGAKNIGAFSANVSALSKQHSDSIETSFDGLQPNTDYKYCALITHKEKIIITNDTQTTDGSSESEACVIVRFKPETAEVDSDTMGVINSSYLASNGSGNYYKSGIDKDKDFGLVKVKAGSMKIAWAHFLGYRNLTDSAITSVKTSYSINNGGMKNTPIDSYPNSSTGPAISAYKLEKEQVDTGVFPGETRTEKRSIQHPSKVEASTGKATEDSINEQSSVTLKLHADDLRCGLDNDHMYNIGVDHPDDYFWLSMQRADNNKVTVGSGMDSRASMWFNPFDQMRVTQVACFGSQILVDSQDRENKWTTNPWEINESTLENHIANTTFNLGGDGHDAIKNTGVFTNKNAANYEDSHGGSSLWASEIGGASSTPSVRISKGYKLEATSETKQISNLGEDLQLTFSNTWETQSVSINAKVPYNYYLDLSFSGSDGSTILDGVTSFKPKVTNEGRDNAQLCAGRKSACNAASIGTSTRTTYAATLIFSVDDSFTYESLKNNFDFAVDGKNTTESGILNSVKSRLGSAINVIDGSYFSYKDSGKKAISTNGYWKLNNPTTVDSRDYPVGTKICGVVAAYPADSHNTGDGRAIDDDAQIAAFNSYGGIFKTKFNISCRTVAKRQTMSVEGNGITALGLVKSSRVYYGTQNRIFGSWSEYQIIASGSDGQSASSGAVTAYGIDGTGGSTDPFATKDADTASISGNGANTLLFPQSLGNTKGDPYAPSEAQINWQYSENLIGIIKNKYVGSSGSCSDLTENRRALRCLSGDQSLGNGLVDIEDMDTIVVYSNGKITITEDLAIPSTSRQLIIIAKSIEIESDVKKVNAWLIVDGGEFNTCAGHIIDRPNHPENSNSHGNMELLQECYNNLLINGPVILKTGSTSGYNPVQLPRTFGGGSKPDGDSFVRAPETYVQRAEVFNYDPEIVEWAYNESRKEPQIVTTYTESLTPRL